MSRQENPDFLPNSGPSQNSIFERPFGDRVHHICRKIKQKMFKKRATFPWKQSQMFISNFKDKEKISCCSITFHKIKGTQDCNDDCIIKSDGSRKTYENLNIFFGHVDFPSSQNIFRISYIQSKKYLELGSSFLKIQFRRIKKQCRLIFKEMKYVNYLSKVSSSYHLCVECFSQLSFDSELYTKSATAADFVYTSESNESCEKHSTER